MKGDSPRKKRQYLIVTVLVLLFFAPFLLARGLYFTGWHSKLGTTNHGNLIAPPIPVSRIPFYNDQHQRLDTQTIVRKTREQSATTMLHGKWLLLYVASPQCDRHCQKGLFYLRQMKKAAGKDSSRIESAALTFSDATTKQENGTSLSKLLKDHFSQIRHFVTAQPEFVRALQKRIEGNTIAAEGALYIIDPHGNIIMSYQAGAKPADVFEDLQHLLKVSQIG